MLKKTITSAKAKCEFDFYLDGSLLADTISSGVTEFRTFLEIESPEPDDVIARIIRAAKRGCFAEQLVTTAVPLVSTYAVNGQLFELLTT